LIDTWQYILGFGIFIAGLGGALQLLLPYDDLFKKKIEDYEAIYKTKFFEDWSKKIFNKKKQKQFDMGDTQLNVGMKELFTGAGIFKECENLNQQYKESVRYIQITVIFLGIFIAAYPFAMMLPQEIITLYYSGLIVIVIFVSLSIIFYILKGKKLKKKVDRV